MSNIDRWDRAVGRRLRELAAKALPPRGPQDVLELRQGILDAIEERVEDIGDGRRIFPFNRLIVELPTRDAARQAAFEEAFRDRAELIREIARRLSDAGCEPPPGLQAEVRVLETRSGTKPFRIQFVKESREVPRVRFSLRKGEGGRKVHVLCQERIHIGRGEEVRKRSGRLLRRNDVVLDTANTSVSRIHAHARYDWDAECFRIIDDGSEHGTVVRRGNRAIPVPKGDNRGVLLQADDEVQIGQAALRFEILGN